MFSIDDEKYRIELGDPYDLMTQHISDNSIDLIITCPQYNVRIKKTVTHLYRILKNKGIVVWITGDADNRIESGLSFKTALTFIDQGFILYDTMIWKRLLPSISKLRYHPSFEYMFIFSKNELPSTINLIKDRPNNDTFLCRENIWECAFEGAKNLPIPLALDHILSWSNEGDLIFDPFLKYGSVGVAALRANRKFIGFERNKTYFKLAKKRIENWKDDTCTNIKDDLYETWSEYV